MATLVAVLKCLLLLFPLFFFPLTTIESCDLSLLMSFRSPYRTDLDCCPKTSTVCFVCWMSLLFYFETVSANCPLQIAFREPRLGNLKCVGRLCLTAAPQSSILPLLPPPLAIPIDRLQFSEQKQVKWKSLKLRNRKFSPRFRSSGLVKLLEIVVKSCQLLWIWKDIRVWVA